MKKIVLNNIYYKQNKETEGYKDIYLETSIGVLRVYVACLDFEIDINLQSMFRLIEIDKLKEKYGSLYIDEVRRTYDNDMYLLLSGKLLLAIQYILNSNFEHSVQEFRTIEDIEGLNKSELEEFKGLDVVVLPSDSTSK